MVSPVVVVRGHLPAYQPPARNNQPHRTVTLTTASSSSTRISTVKLDNVLLKTDHLHALGVTPKLAGACVCARACVCMCACVRERACACACVCVFARACVCACVCVCVCVADGWPPTSSPHHQTLAHTTDFGLTKILKEDDVVLNHSGAGRRLAGDLALFLSATPARFCLPAC